MQVGPNVVRMLLVHTWQRLTHPLVSRHHMKMLTLSTSAMRSSERECVAARNKRLDQRIHH